MNCGLHLVSAHSVVALAENLAARISERPNPFSPETVLVMNFAQRVWLRRFLAERLGVCANVEFLSPEAFLERLVRRRGKTLFERGAFAWRLYEKLKELHAPGAGMPAALKFGLDGKPDEEIFRRAAELGDLFWRYQSFRPEMMRDWTRDAPEPKNADADFLAEYRRQKNLWRALDFGGETPPALAWLELLENPEPVAGTPARVFAFAPSALPRLHFELLEKLSRNAEVFLHYHNLSTFLWTERREKKKVLRERLRAKANPAALFPDDDEGNELLAAWGKAAKPLAERLVDSGLLDHESNLDAPPERDSLLHALQRAIRDDVSARERFLPAAGDVSLKISAAPDPLREMEILRDELTARFAADATLRPRDVLVTIADLDAYAPFVRAAFEGSGIPFSVADRAGTELFPCAAAFLAILRVAHGEMRLDEVLSLLDFECVRAGLALDEEEARALGRAFSDAGVRWGADERFRRERIFGAAPKIAEEMSEAADTLADNNSWAFGLRRLALGYLFGAEEEKEILPLGPLNALPFPALREEAPLALGKFSRLLRVLEEIGKNHSSGAFRSVPEWCAFLSEILVEELFAGKKSGGDVLRSALAELSESAKNAGPRVPECSFETLCAALEGRDWSSSRGAGGMLRGKVTFCRMQPMRNIPARVVAVCGLGNGAFPRDSAKNAGDLLAFPPRNFPAGTAGWDRSSRDDDCLLFLETLLAAKDALLLSYVCRDAADGQALPPCVPLSKLRDFLGELTGEISPDVPGSDAVGAPGFETLHRLHGFSPEYFSPEESKLFSFSRADYLTARAARSADAVPAAASPRRTFPFEIPETLSARELADFFKSPAKFLCSRALGIADGFSAGRPESDDPLKFNSPLDVCRMHSFFLERELDAARPRGGLIEATRRFRARELSAGRAPALASEIEYDEAFGKKINDAESAGEILPGLSGAVGAEELPAPPEFDCGNGVRIRILPDFSALRRDAEGGLFLPLYGKKTFDWRVAVETFVAAAMLEASFPRAKFRVAYFVPDSKSPKLVTEESFARAETSAADLVGFFARAARTPPLLFENIPISGETMSETRFLADVREAWTTRGRDAREIFVFGENAIETHGDDLLKVVYPFVCRICSAFEKEK